MTVEGEVETPDEREGFMGLRQAVADGQIEGEEYDVTQNLGSGHIVFEFQDDDGITAVRYSLGDMVQDAYQQVYEVDEA